MHLKIKNQLLFITISVVFLMVTSCKKQNNLVLKTFDQKWDSILKNKTSQESILLIDSILSQNSYSNSEKAIFYFQQGKHYSILQEDLNANKKLEKALQLFIQLKDNDYIAHTHWLLGSSYAFLSQKNKATEHLITALKISEETQNTLMQTNVYNSLAHLYYLNKNYAQAEQYISKAIEIQINNKDSLGLSASYNNLAILLKNIEKYDKAIDYNLKSLELNKLLKSQSGIAKSYNNLGLVNELKGNSLEAIEYYYKAIKINEENNFNNSSPLINLGDYQLKNKNYTEASLAYQKALAIEQKNKRFDEQKRIREKLLQIAIANHQNQTLLTQYQAIDSLNQLKINQEKNEKLDYIKSQYNLLTQQKNLQQLKTNATKNFIIFGTTLAIFILIILLIYLRLKNQKLKSEHEKSLLEQRVLTAQMNPHFIFNTLTTIQNSLLDNDVLKVSSQISKFAKLIRQNFDYINVKSISLTDEINVLTNYLETQQLRFNNQFSYQFEIQDDLETDTINIPPMLLQPFVENSIEHGFSNLKKNGIVIIKIYQKNNKVIFEIKDNGIGKFIEKQDDKEHAIDIFKKRLKLLGKGDENSFLINATPEGTQISFSITL